ncbi:transcriptional regulator, IclR family [Streptomyces sp. DfronAA-171]|nr:transcriptional regulator, IclR family [Streptomyces sp. DfronAA-171]
MPSTSVPPRTRAQQSVQDALRVLEALSRRAGGARTAELSAETGLDTDRLGALLAMLCGQGYACRLDDGGYVTGESLSLLGGSSLNSEFAIRGHLQGLLDRLRDEVNAAVYVGRYVDGEITVTSVADAPETPRVHEWVDFRSTGHASAVGKALLSQLGPEARREHLSRHRPARFTARTITDTRALFSRLEARTPVVPVLDVQEYAVGTVCAAVPMSTGPTVGCLALSLPARHAHRLHAAAAALSRGSTPVLLSLTI